MTLLLTAGLAIAAPAADYPLPAGGRIFAAAPAGPPAAVVRLVVPAVNQADVAERYDPHPQYQVGYAVADALSGDSKAREETRDGDLVTGSYTVADPDGRIRTVTYTADSVHGFQARVTYDGAPGPVAIPFVGAPAFADATAEEDYYDEDAAAIAVARTPGDDSTPSSSADGTRVTAAALSPTGVARPAVTIFRQQAAAPLVHHPHAFSPPLVHTLNAPVAGLAPLDFSQFRFVPAGAAPPAFIAAADRSPAELSPPLRLAAFGPSPTRGALDFSQLRFVSGGNIF